MSATAFLFMVINFVILIGALIFFAGKSVKAKFTGRVLKIHEDLEASMEAGIKAQELLASVSQVDSLAAQRRNDIFSDANEMIERNSEESARKCLEEKEGILKDAEDVRSLMAADMHGRVYLDTIDRLADSVEYLLKDEKFSGAKKQLQDRFITSVQSVLKPSRSDFVNLNEFENIDMVISGSEEIEQEYIDKLHDLVADRFLSCEFETDSELGTDIQIQVGDKIYRGTVESIMEDIDRDSYIAKNSSPFASTPVDLTIMGEEMNSSDVETLKKIITDNFMNFDFETDPSQSDEVELQFGDKVYKGTFDKVLEQIGTDMA